MTPAAEVLGSLPYDHEPTRKTLAGLLDRLGTDPVNWLTCYARMGRARGSVAEAHRRRRLGHLPPEAQHQLAAPLGGGVPGHSPEASRAAFLHLFQCASEEAQIAVVPHFDARAVQHLLVYGDPAPAVRDAVIAAHGVAAQAAQAATTALSPRSWRTSSISTNRRWTPTCSSTAASTRRNGCGCSPDGCAAAVSAPSPRSCSPSCGRPTSATTVTGSSPAWTPVTWVWRARSSGG
ncbi:hypothetical protein NCG97_25470 [Streptomyces lydicamycinicus]|uniref:hypothetical protein n=1 Tax=Streptomyces lydicamycinicus TaxID=1546107 RepID=UPI002035F452|nr:hypothetical protein [Streptomyces lydicamycinicus]USA03226.1 hypothetical protein NCG97_25470 [Streptomyces lydicamycinicus]